MASQASRYSRDLSRAWPKSRARPTVAANLSACLHPQSYAANRQFWYVKPSKRGEYHTVYVTNDHRVTLYTKVK